MKGKKAILMLLIIGKVICTIAQPAIWTNAGVEKQIKKWEFEVGTGYRTQSKSGNFQRWNLKVEAAYKIIKPIKLGLGYEYLGYNDLKYDDYQPRTRYLAFLQAKQKFGDLTFSIREQGQRTVKDESDRIKTNSEYDTYKINPEWYWRNKIKIAYNIPGWPITPAVSFETYYQLNNPDGNQFTNLRYTLAFGYKMNKHQYFELYGLLKNDISESQHNTNYILGLSYLYSF